MKFVALYATEGSKSLISRHLSADDRIEAIQASQKLTREIANEAKAKAYFYGLRRADRGVVADEVAATKRQPLRRKA